MAVRKKNLLSNNLPLSSWHIIMVPFLVATKWGKGDKLRCNDSALISRESTININFIYLRCLWYKVPLKQQKARKLKEKRLTYGIREDSAPNKKVVFATCDERKIFNSSFIYASKARWSEASEMSLIDKCPEIGDEI